VLVDCGMFQGLKSLRLQNWEPLPLPASSINAVVLTHAHIDHSGYLPKLYRDGFRGPVYCTPPTAELCEILLMDSARLMEEESRYANKKGYSKHKPALPLFTTDDARLVLSQLVKVSFHSERSIEGGLSIRFGRAGHILGAANVVVTEAGGKRIAFSGDVGRMNDAVMLAPEPLPPADVLVIESTYGNRAHLPTDPGGALREAINKVAARGGSVLIPAFAVGRAQQILYHLSRLTELRLIPNLPMILDSPMANRVTRLYQEFPNEHRLNELEREALASGVRYVTEVEESIRVQQETDPRIVVSASGMATGGRVLHYLKKMAPQPQNLILFAGYQAVGTRGASLVSGEPEIKIHGEYFPVRAEIRNLENLSAHADAAEIVDWLSHSEIKPSRVFVTHGEPAAADAMRLRLTDRFGWRCEVASQGQVATIE
jgi:metallo-beta-lactamase family protein